jgi:hypothetical protein
MGSGALLSTEDSMDVNLTVVELTNFDRDTNWFGVRSFEDRET